MEFIKSFKNGTLRLSGRGKIHIYVEIQMELGITPPAIAPYLLTEGMLIVVNPEIRTLEAKNKLMQALEYLDYYDNR